MKLATLHPLGFWKLYLFRGFGYAIRLHVWLDGQDAVEDPHDHRWPFWSLPLWGSLTDDRWLVSVRRDLPTTHVRYTATPDRGEGRDYVEAGSDRLVRVEENVRKPLRLYSCPVGAIHSFAPRRRRAATLVLLGRTMAGESNVWRRL